MDNKEKKQTRDNIISSGTLEFLHKGYSGADLRSICKAAGVTTGAFYFSFKNKEDLLHTILSPVIAKAEKLVPRLLQQEINHPDSASVNDEIIMKFELEYKNEILILMEKSDGSCYESFPDTIESMLESAFLSYFRSRLGYEPNKDLIHILAAMRIQSNLSILKGDYDMQYSLKLSQAIGIHADGGTDKLIAFIKGNAH